ncbi:MAG: VWA domain-containing protein, partial [Bacteroidetes bacterium]|nr:VWA domain-containing protein [Bacteroidota bacterium]
MKLFLLSFFLFAVVAIAPAQGELTVKIRLIDTQYKAMGGVEINLKETVSGNIVKAVTGADGAAEVTLNSGYEWTISFLDIVNYGTVTVPPQGKSMESKTMTYNPEKMKKELAPRTDRSAMNIEIIDQTALNPKKADKTNAWVKVCIKTMEKKPLPDYTVDLTSLELKKTYRSKTNAAGVASFSVPPDEEFDIDIDGNNGYKTVHSLAVAGSIKEKTIYYQPDNVIEKEVGDTVRQEFPDGPNPSSVRSLLIVIAVDRYGAILSNEEVFINDLGSNKVYAAVTDRTGQAFFMLPNRKKYMIHFTYQRDVDFLDLSRVTGFSQATYHLTYIPNPRLQHPEEFIPKPEELFLVEFNEFLTRQFAPPEGNKALRMTAEWCNPVVNSASKEAVLQIGFTARDVSADENYGPPVNVSFVIDRSGSMGGYDRIESLIKSMTGFVDQIRPSDIVSLVTFDTEAVLKYPAGPKGDGDELKRIIGELEARGGTNIYNGMVMGYEEVLKNMLPKGTNRLVLLTDGYGTTEVDVVVKKSKSYNEKGVGISAIGVGEDYNYALLKLLTGECGGLNQYAGKAPDIEKVFAREMMNMLRPIASDVKVEILYNDRIVFSQLYGYEAVIKGKNTAEMNLTNIYSSTNR